MPQIPEMPSNWREDTATLKQLRMAWWLLNCRGIIISRQSGGPYQTKGQMSKLIDKLLTYTSNDEIIEMLLTMGINIERQVDRGRSWQEIAAEDTFERAL